MPVAETKNGPPKRGKWKAPETEESEAYETFLKEELGAQLNPDLVKTQKLPQEFEREFEKFKDAVTGIEQAINIVVEKLGKDPKVREAIGQLLDEASSLAELKGTEVTEESRVETAQLIKNMRTALEKIELLAKTLKDFDNDTDGLTERLTEIKAALESGLEVTA